MPTKQKPTKTDAPASAGTSAPAPSGENAPAPAPAAAPTAPESTTPEPATPETTETTAAELVAPLGERMPPVTEAAGSAESPATAPTTPAPATAPAPTTETTGPEIRDSRGVRFNSFRHQTEADGVTPKKNSKGNFVLKNEYRLGKIRPGSADSPSFAQQPTAPGEAGAIPADQYDAAAEVYLQAAFGPLQIAFGSEIRADKDDHAALKTALANYLRSTGATELSPGWALTVTVAAFAAKKASVPTVQERALTLWEKTKALFGRKPKPAA